MKDSRNTGNSAAKKVKVGELTKTSLLRADGELSGARADYLRATNALVLARAALIRLTGIEGKFPSEASGKFIRIPIHLMNCGKQLRIQGLI